MEGSDNFQPRLSTTNIRYRWEGTFPGVRDFTKEGGLGLVEQGAGNSRLAVREVGGAVGGLAELGHVGIGVVFLEGEGLEELSSSEVRLTARDSSNVHRKPLLESN